MATKSAISCGVIMLCAACCAPVIADPPQTLSEAKLRMVRDVSAELRAAPRSSPRIWVPKPVQAVTLTDRVDGGQPTQARVVRHAGGVRHAASPIASAENPAIRQVSERSVLVPIQTEDFDDSMQFEGADGLVTLVTDGAQLPRVLRLIAQHHGLNLVVGPDVNGPVTVSIEGARLEEVLDAILGVAGYAWHRVDNLLYVTSANGAGMDPRVLGRRVQVYPLNYVAATDVEAVANQLLSPAGTATITESDSADQLKTRELLIVEDTSAAHHRIAAYIAQVDIPPRQVLVEAHVLQISLNEEERHGINFKSLARVEGGAISIEGKNLADDPANDPAIVLRVEGKDMNGLIELIRENTNSRTLASPKLSVVNRQEAKIQIGQRLPYSVATTTQTTTVESVEFLEVGIVLTVQPVITDDGNVLMNVLPKVSGGKILESGFPEEDTTEVQTTILLPDGGGVIIGGLIREDNVHARAIVPYVDKVPVLGKLFRKRSDDVRRNELVVALVTHVMDDACGMRRQELLDLEHTLPPYASEELRSPQVPIGLGY